MEGFSDRLAELIGGNRKKAEFARLTGVGEANLRQYLTGRTPGLDKVVQIAKATGVSITWLATGEGPRDSRSDLSHVPNRTEQEQSEIPMQMVDPQSLDGTALVLLPRLDVSAAAGAGRLAPAYPEVQGFVALGEEYLRSIGVPPRYARLLEIAGDSMFPTLKDRDVAVVDTSILEVVSDAVYAVSYGGLVLAKRVQIARDGSVTLSSDNKGAGYRDERIPNGELHDLHIVGRIKGRLGSL